MYILLKSGEQFGKQGDAHKEYLLESASDVSELPTTGVAPGSMAHTVGFTHFYEMGFDNQWHLFGPASGS